MFTYDCKRRSKQVEASITANLKESAHSPQASCKIIVLLHR